MLDVQGRDRSPGWDARVRTRASTRFGNLATFASMRGIKVDRHPMRTWANIVDHYHGTEGVEEYLDRIG